jgi:hypothetical protein
MMIFGFEYPDKFTKDEFHYFLDSFFQGICSFVICTGHETPHLRGTGLKDADIASLVDHVFPSKKQIIERSEFVTLFEASEQISEITTYLGEQMQIAIKENQQRNIERTHIRALLRKTFLDMFKVVFTQVEERAQQRIKDAAQAAVDSRNKKDGPSIEVTSTSSFRNIAQLKFKSTMVNQEKKMESLTLSGPTEKQFRSINNEPSESGFSTSSKRYTIQQRRQWKQEAK